MCNSLVKAHFAIWIKDLYFFALSLICFLGPSGILQGIDEYRNNHVWLWEVEFSFHLFVLSISQQRTSGVFSPTLMNRSPIDFKKILKRV